jgi:hypothetical protein
VRAGVVEQRDLVVVAPNVSCARFAMMSGSFLRLRFSSALRATSSVSAAKPTQYGASGRLRHRGEDVDGGSQCNREPIARLLDLARRRCCRRVVCNRGDGDERRRASKVGIDAAAICAALTTSMRVTPAGVASAWGR